MTSVQNRIQPSGNVERIRELHTILRGRGFVERVERTSDASLFTREVRRDRRLFHVDVRTALRADDIGVETHFRGHTDDSSTAFLTHIFPDRDHRTADTIYLARLTGNHDVDAILDRAQELHIAVQSITKQLRLGYHTRRLLRHMSGELREAVGEPRGLTLRDAGFVSTLKRMGCSTDISSLALLVRRTEQEILASPHVVSAIGHVAVREPMQGN